MLLIRSLSQPLRLATLTLFLVINLLARASGFLNPVVLTDETDEVVIARENVRFLIDTTSSMTLADVLNLNENGKHYQSTDAPDLINDQTEAAYWLKFKIKNESENDVPFRIELYDFDIEEISFFYPNPDGDYIEEKAGFSYPFSFRALKHKNVSFRVPTYGLSTCTMYMRIYSEKKNVLEPIIRPYDHAVNYWLSEYILFGVFYGLLLLMIVYNLIYFINLQKSYYLYYVLYGAGVLVYLMSKNGTGFQYLWPNFPAFNLHAGIFGLGISSICLILFTINFLSLHSVDKKLYRYLLIGMMIRVLILTVQMFFSNDYLYEVVDFVYVQVVFLIALKLRIDQISSAKWIVIAFSVLNVSFIISLLEQVAIIPSNIITVYAINLGIVFQFIFLSIGIAETVKDTYRERSKAQADLIVQYQQNEELKEKVNRELEQKVKERTQELDQANNELKQKMEENIQMSIALDIANSKLKKHITTFAQTSVTKAYLNFEDFKKAYPDEITCIQYLKSLKEKQGFECVKCGNTKAIRGKAKFDVRCSSCGYNESLTANTIFHRTRFPLQKAFYLVYLVWNKKGRLTTADLSKSLELQHSTCQNFKTKVQDRIKVLKRKKASNDLAWDEIIMDLKSVPEAKNTV